jgi:hypothetical protein
MSNDRRRHRIALERWRKAFDAYLRASTAPDRSRARRELARWTADADRALTFVKYDIAVPDHANGFRHGLTHVVPWIDSRKYDSTKPITKIEALGESRISSFTDGVIFMLDCIILELGDSL